MIHVYVWKQVTELELIQIKKIIEGTLGAIPTVVHALKDNILDHHLRADTCICFGSRSFNLIKEKYPEAVELPELSKLIDLPGNSSYRLETWDKLKGLVNNKPEDSKLELKPEDVARNLTIKNQNLHKQLQADNTEYWIGTTALGKKVVIKPTANPSNISCDYSLTFEELYAAKLAIEILGLETLTLVKGKKDD